MGGGRGLAGSDVFFALISCFVLTLGECGVCTEVGGGFDSFGFGGSCSPWFRRLVSSPGLWVMVAVLGGRTAAGSKWGGCLGALFWRNESCEVSSPAWILGL